MFPYLTLWSPGLQGSPAQGRSQRPQPPPPPHRSAPWSPPSQGPLSASHIRHVTTPPSIHTCMHAPALEQAFTSAHRHFHHYWWPSDCLMAQGCVTKYYDSCAEDYIGCTEDYIQTLQACKWGRDGRPPEPRPRHGCAAAARRAAAPAPAHAACAPARRTPTSPRHPPSHPQRDLEVHSGTPCPLHLPPPAPWSSGRLVSLVGQRC